MPGSHACKLALALSWPPEFVMQVLTGSCTPQSAALASGELQVRTPHSAFLQLSSANVAEERMDSTEEKETKNDTLRSYPIRQLFRASIKTVS